MDPIERVRRPLTRRPRASIACNNCRQTKSKCDGKSPTCERCARLRVDCVYSESGRDKRLDRRTEQRANLDLRNRVRELEAQLAAATGGPQSRSVGESGGEGDPEDGERGDHLRPGNNVSLDANSEDPSRAASAHESPVDVLAAGVFDHPSSGYMCYFGSSSNHAVFWSLTASIANMGHRSSHLYKEPLWPGRDNRGPAQLPIPPSSSVKTHHDKDADKSLMPDRSTAVRWISRFFDTVGATLPYLTEPGLLAGLDKVLRNSRDEPSTRSLRPLLSIVFAHALSTLDEGSPEPFYRRTLRLLDPKTTYVSSLELLQSLMLLSVYQQNSQRSTESLTTHALAVKTSYHLGIHATFLYEFVSVREKEIRARLWFAVVNQDRMLSSALGQPCLIPMQHVRDDIGDFLDATGQNRTVEMSYSRENLTYFRNITSLHEIMGVALDSIYDSNISTSTRLPLAELISKTLQLSLRLESWRRTNMPAGPIGTSVDFSSWDQSTFDSERNRILTSMFYYRTAILIHGSLLMHVLELATGGSSEVACTVLQDSVTSLLKSDFAAVTGLHHLIRGMIQYNRHFLKSNPIWWTCNYAALTLSLHLFGFWVASKSPQASFIALGMESSELEYTLQEFLDTLKAIGVSSAMSVKAHRCLHRHLTFLTSTGPTSTMNSHPSAQADPGTDRSGDFSTTSAVPNASQDVRDGADFLGNTAVEWFGDVDFQYLFNADSFGLQLGVSDFDATGLI